MLAYLIELPREMLGQHMLGFLEMIDIIQWENAAASQESQELLRAILPYCPPIRIIDSITSRPFHFNPLTCNWFNKRRCRAELVNISIDVLQGLGNHNSVLDNIELSLNQTTSFKQLGYLKDPIKSQRVICLKIKESQDPAVMEVLFSLLSSVRSLVIQSLKPSQWIDPITKIGPCLRNISIHVAIDFVMLTTITEYSPYLEKLSLKYRSRVSDSNILQSIANNCPHLHSLEILLIDYPSSTEADADLTAFAEKCPQLEELSLYCGQLTDQSVIALSQHCSRLKKLALFRYKLTAASLIALSERGLPLEELDIPRIPIPSPEIAAQCAHALSRIRELRTEYYEERIDELLYVIQYMTGLRELYLNSSEDHMLVPHLLLLLLGQYCAGLESLVISDYSCITTEQLSQLVTLCPQLLTICVDQSTCASDVVLVELAHNCPHLQKVTLDCSSEVTEEGVLALAAHCRQLREIYLPKISVTEETVRQLVQHYRRLTRLSVRVAVREGEVMVEHNKDYYSKEIRALRETERESCRAE